MRGSISLLASVFVCVALGGYGASCPAQDGLTSAQMENRAGFVSDSVAIGPPWPPYFPSDQW